jgi:hypothetical protein
MAVTKGTRRSTPDTNATQTQLFQTLFKNLRSPNAKDRQRSWQDALRYEGTGDPALRFPVYEHLYLINVCAQKMIELLQELSGKFALNTDTTHYNQSLIQYVRSNVTGDILRSMKEVEITESWLFQSQYRREEKKLFDPDDIYLLVREREVERINQGLPPRIRFLNEKPPK